MNIDLQVGGGTTIMIAREGHDDDYVSLCTRIYIQSISSTFDGGGWGHLGPWQYVYFSQKHMTLDYISSNADLKDIVANWLLSQHKAFSKKGIHYSSDPIKLLSTRYISSSRTLVTFPFHQH